MSAPILLGPHKLLAGDLTSGAVNLLMGDERADVIYSDPPWGPGLLQSFATMHEKGSLPRLPWPDFLGAFCGVCARHRTPDAPVFVEMGLRWADELAAAMDRVGLPLRRRWNVTYGAKSRPSPSTVTLFGPRDLDLLMPDPPHGEPVTRVLLGAVVKPGARVLDPCTGLGMTARVTHALGGQFRGVELNPARLDRTEAWLRKATRSKRA